MKTMRSTDGKRIWRTTNEKASQLYQDGEANYTSKEEWKREVRDLDKPKEEGTKKVKLTNLPKHRNDK